MVENARNARIPLVQDVLVPTNWTGRDYPRETGWNRLGAGADKIPYFAYYVYGPNAWKGVAASHLLEANQRSFSNAETVSQVIREQVSIPAPVFFATFLLAVGWLWLAP